MTDQHAWSAAEIIGAYRSQSVVEGVFRTLKDPLRLALSPPYHWTDQKLHLHAWLCVLASLAPPGPGMRFLLFFVFIAVTAPLPSAAARHP